MKHYDPSTPPDAAAWQAMGETRRIEQVLTYHRKAGLESGNARVHATIHVIVENQLLLGDETPVAAAVARLMGEGLDRHEAIHAVGSVLAGHLFGMVKGPMAGDPSKAYFREVEEMTAEKWYALGE